MASIVGHTVYADDGTGRSWDLDAMVRTDGDGTTHPQAEWSARELEVVAQWRSVVFRSDRIELIRSEVAVLRARAAMADDDFNATTDKLTTAQAEAAQIKGSTPAVTLAYVTAIRDKLGIVADAIVDGYRWRQDVDSLMARLCLDLAWLSQVVGEVTQDPP